MKLKITAAVAAVCIAVWIAGSGCHIERQNDPGDKVMPRSTIVEVLKAHTPLLMDIEGVVGTAEGEHQGKPCVRIFVVDKTPELLEKLPSELEGFPVIIQQTGDLKAR